MENQKITDGRLGGFFRDATSASRAVAETTATEDRYTVCRDGEVYDYAPAFHDAEELVERIQGEATGASDEPVFTICNAAGEVLSSFTHGRIIGTFFKQAWSGDNAIDLGTEQFDATAAVLQMDHAELVGLQDHRDSTDEIGLAHVAWGGPFGVRIVPRICSHFGVSALTEISETHFSSVRTRFFNRPAIQSV